MTLMCSVVLSDICLCLPLVFIPASLFMLHVLLAVLPFVALTWDGCKACIAACHPSACVVPKASCCLEDWSL